MYDTPECLFCDDEGYIEDSETGAICVCTYCDAIFIMQIPTHKDEE